MQFEEEKGYILSEQIEQRNQTEEEDIYDSTNEKITKEGADLEDYMKRSEHLGRSITHATPYNAFKEQAQQINDTYSHASTNSPNREHKFITHINDNVRRSFASISANS